MASMRAAFLVKCGARERHDPRFHHLACCRGRMGLVRAVIGMARRREQREEKAARDTRERHTSYKSMVIY